MLSVCDVRSKFVLVGCLSASGCRFDLRRSCVSFFLIHRVLNAVNGLVNSAVVFSYCLLVVLCLICGDHIFLFLTAYIDKHGRTRSWYLSLYLCVRDG